MVESIAVGYDGQMNNDDRLPELIDLIESVRANHLVTPTPITQDRAA